MTPNDRMPDPTQPPPPKKRCTIYLDAFNWYFGVFQHRPAWKWLNIQSFFEALRLDEDVVAVKFFTALVNRRSTSVPGATATSDT